MTESSLAAARLNKKRRMVCAFYLIIGSLTITQQVTSFHIPKLSETRRRLTKTVTYPKSSAQSVGSSSLRFPVLFSTPSNEEDPEKEWGQEESLLVMNLSPLPDVSCEDSLSRISQYIRSFPFAAVLPVQPLQALPTDDGGLEIKFLRKKTHIKPGVDGGIRFFVKVSDEKNDSIEVLVKRNSDGQSVPKMFAEKLVVQSFAKGMALGSDYGNDNNDQSSSVKVPNTRIESPTKDMVQIQSIFHKWI